MDEFELRDAFSNVNGSMPLFCWAYIKSNGKAYEVYRVVYLGPNHSVSHFEADVSGRTDPTGNIDYIALNILKIQQSYLPARFHFIRDPTKSVDGMSANGIELTETQRILTDDEEKILLRFFPTRYVSPVSQYYTLHR